MTFHDQPAQPDPAVEPEPHPSVDAQTTPPKRRRVGLIAGISAVAVIAVAGGAYALTSSGGSGSPAAQAAPPPTTAAPAEAASATSPATTATTASPVATKPLDMKFPTSAGTLTLMTGSAGDKVTGELQQANTSLPNSTLYGGYEQTGTSTHFADLILLRLHNGDATAYESTYTSTDPNSALLQINGAQEVSGFTAETPAEPGGAMICGKYAQSSVLACTWIDATEYGTASFPSSLSVAKAAAFATALWKASEQS